MFDSVSTIVLGRIGSNGRPIWHPRFIEFAKYYAFQPFLCKVRDPDRKGRAENSLWFLERSLVRGPEFSSFADPNARAHQWLDQVANRRVHGTAGLVPEEAWLAERVLLIRLPENRFAVYQDAVRQVGPDATVWVHGTPRDKKDWPPSLRFLLAARVLNPLLQLLVKSNVNLEAFSPVKRHFMAKP